MIGAARNEVRPFSEREIGLVEQFADQVAIAVVLARQLATIERQRTESARYAAAGGRAAVICRRPAAPQRPSAGDHGALRRPARLHGVRREGGSRGGPRRLAPVPRNGWRPGGRRIRATLEHFAGDGLMVFFNDPTPMDDHQLAAVRTACEMRDRFAHLAGDWHKRGYDLGLGIGIAVGYATIGPIDSRGATTTVPSGCR